MAQTMPRKQTVSQTIEEDDFGSFIVVHRWANENGETISTPPSLAADKKDEHEETLAFLEGQSDNGEGEEHFSDAAADLDHLGSSETLVISPHSSIEDPGQGIEGDRGMERSTGSSNNASSVIRVGVGSGPPLSHFTTSQEGALLDDERFSMTNYSTASSSSDQQLEELQTKLNHVIADHRGLVELLEKQNLELEQRKMAIEELKLLANESVLREKEKSEESRKIVERITVERDLAIKKLERSENAVSSLNQSGFQALENLEAQLKQREHIIKQNNEQIIELSTRLHQEIVKHEELSELLRKKEQEDKVKSDSLSDSDEALARSLSDKERMEQILEEAMKGKTALQQEVANLKEQLENLTSENTRLHAVCQQMDVQYAAMDTEGREMLIKCRALEAENERQIELYNQEASKNAGLEQDKVGLQRDLGRLSEMLQLRTNELQKLEEQRQGGGNPMVAAGNLISGLFKNPLKPSSSTVNIPVGGRSYGMRDDNDDPNEPFQENFEHVGNQAEAMQSNQGNVPRNTPDPVFQCPICLKRFSDLRKLEYHASNCGVDNATNSDPFVFP